MSEKTDATTKKLKIDWDGLEAAFEHSNEMSEMGSHYPHLDTRTGKVVFAREGDDTDENGDPVDWDHLVWIPTLDSHDESRWIDDFRASLRNRALINALDRMESGRGFFRRFRDILTRHGALDDWNEFRSDCVTQALVDWLRREQIAFEPPPGFEDDEREVASDASDDGGKIPVRATIQQQLNGHGIIRLGDAIEALENAAREAVFEYDITVRVRSDAPLSAKERKALEKRAIDALMARPVFADDEKK